MNIILNLDENFKSFSGTVDFTPASIFKFNAGEVHVKFPDMFKLALINNDIQHIYISHRLNSSDNIMELLLATSYIRSLDSSVKINLIMPYIPYARQDRAMTKNEPTSIKVFADIINSQNYNAVHVLDPHSDVSSALINNIRIMPTIQYIRMMIKTNTDMYTGNDYHLVSPDAGALKKVYNVAESMNYKGKIAVGMKHRDVKTGAITNTTVDVDDFEGKPCFIIDDICSGGRTFIELAKVLKSRNAGKVFLYVTHFEKRDSYDNLMEYIDGVYTTNSIFDIENDNKFVTQYIIS